jgi:hypothetical protein
MEFPGSRIVLGVLLALASVASFWIAVGWFRQTREMQRTGEARPLMVALPQFMETDIYLEIFRRVTDVSRDGRPPWLQEQLNRVRFTSTITMNYLKVLSVAMLGLMAMAGLIANMR